MKNLQNKQLEKSKRTRLKITSCLLFVLVLFAFNCSSKYTKNEEDNGFKFYSRAMEQFQAKNYSDALGFIDEAIQANDRIAVYFELRGDIFNGMNSLDKSLAAYADAKSRRSFYPEIYVKTGDIHYRRNNYEDAIKDYRKAIAQRPEEPATFLSLVQCYLQLREYELAQNLLGDYNTQITKQKKGLQVEYYVLNAKIKFENKKYKEVADAMAIAGKLRRLSRNECIFYMRSLVELGKLDEAYALALEYKNTLIESDLHFIRGLYYYRQNNFNDARTQLELSIQKKTKIYEAYQLMAEIFRQKGETTQAEKYLSSADPYKSYRLINIDHKY